jgi:hypothetical protein
LPKLELPKPGLLEPALANPTEPKPPTKLEDPRLLFPKPADRLVLGVIPALPNPTGAEDKVLLPKGADSLEVVLSVDLF